MFMADENTEMRGHLMTYPFAMADTGVTFDPPVDEVPDFPGASFNGKKSVLPNVLVT